MPRTRSNAPSAGASKFKMTLVTPLAALLAVAILWAPATLAQREPARRQPSQREPTRQDRVEEFSLPVEQQKKLEVADAPKPSMGELVNVFSRLSASQRRNLGPLSEDERRELQRRDGPAQLRVKVGIVRTLTPEPRLTRVSLARLRSQTAETVGGGRVEIAGDGRLVWTTEISSTGANALRVELRDVDLPQGAKIYVTDGRRQVHGPYSPGRESFWTNTVFGSNVYVQVQIPGAEAERQSTTVAIAAVAHLELPSEQASELRGGVGLLAPVDSSLLVSCGLQVFCRPTTPSPSPSPEDILFETASLGVAHINYIEGGGSFICSGGLLADRQASNTPFFLTANHCFDSPASARSLETFWRYRRVCGQPVPDLSTLPRTLGSTLLATSPRTDFTLVQLSQRPPEGSHFFRWTIENLSSSTTTIYRVHHPSGFSQHLQVSTIQPVNECPGSLPNGQFLYSSPQRGGTRGGSSGSLVFRANGTTPEVVGQLYGACFTDPPECGYWNIDGAFAQTFPNVRRFLDNATPGQGPTVEFVRPEDNSEAPANSSVEIVARIRDTDRVASAELYWQRTNRFLPCPGTNNVDWRCEVSGEEYRWVVDVGAAGPRQYHVRATDSLGDQTMTPTRIINIR